MTDKSKPSSMSDTDIKTNRGLGRRTFILGTLGGTTALAGCVTTVTTVTSGITDSDLGVRADPVGNGRGRRTSGITDSDRGGNADPAGNGRGNRSVTDADVGARADPVGRGYTGRTDSDGGPNADRPGHGRR
jgi:hypothetical protein